MQTAVCKPQQQDNTQQTTAVKPEDSRSTLHTMACGHLK